uniref:Uncharacterized protein n=1 Tax=Pararge aegeria TaxID=116150 RepID=S4PJH3_9NEOP
MGVPWKYITTSKPKILTVFDVCRRNDEVYRSNLTEHSISIKIRHNICHGVNWYMVYAYICISFCINF